MSDQPEALQLADRLDRYAMTFDASPAINIAAAELRRQHAAIGELATLLAECRSFFDNCPAYDGAETNNLDSRCMGAITKYGDFNG